MMRRPRHDYTGLPRHDGGSTKDVSDAKDEPRSRLVDRAPSSASQSHMLWSSPQDVGG